MRKRNAHVVHRRSQQREHVTVKPVPARRDGFSAVGGPGFWTQRPDGGAPTSETWS
jgi:hypothetical protein